MRDRKTKQWVEAVLYGTGNQRRFTHDSPIQLDVWAQYFERPLSSLDILIQPWLDISPADVAETLLDSMPDRLKTRSQIIYNRRVISAHLSLADVVMHVLPFTNWYIEIRKPETVPASPVEGSPAPEMPEEAGPQPSFRTMELPGERELWDDIDCSNMTAAVAEMRGACATIDYPYPRLLSFVRMAGLIFDMQAGPGSERMRVLYRLLDDLIGDPEKPFVKARQELTTRIQRGWQSRFPDFLPAPAQEPLIYSISRNRPARLAIIQSVRTVKGDAASSLFSISCRNLTWAIMDSGIDATHPAFQKDPELPLPPQTDVAARLKTSRVRESYDFSYLRQLLLDPSSPDLPEHVRTLVGATGSAVASAGGARQELLRRIMRSRSVDWDLLRPFLRIEHGPGYQKPADTHGTHVAGILAANWPKPGAGRPPMVGMCPDINLIDIRVCRADGTSDEFVIMSALQFIRHLNSSSDQIAIHGVNMSLSLDHDAAVYACGRTPICDEAERTVANSVVVVAAAGNLGYRRVLGDGELPFDQFCPVSITDPGNAENVITVGATHRLEPHSYGVSYFSSRGPTGDGRVKPDLVAPGEKIYAPALGDDAVRLDGTSMAAPHVSGAAAMLMARHVELIGKPQRIKTILCSTATDLGREPYFQGRGLVDVLRAIQSI